MYVNLYHNTNKIINMYKESSPILVAEFIKLFTSSQFPLTQNITLAS